MKIQYQSKLLMIGDSITDCGRIYESPPLGNGYVRFVHNSMKSNYPESGIEIINRGIGGDTVRDLKKRWQRDVLELKPDWLSIMIGINDVWLQNDDWLLKEEKISIEEYARILGELIASTFPSLKGLILMMPYYLQLDRKDSMRASVDSYGDVVRQYAKKYDAIFVDTQSVFDEVLQEMDAIDLSEDRIHMNAVGHKILADAFLKEIE